jgi:hypothetical protein
MSWDDHGPADAITVQAGMITERLSKVALELNVALGDTNGPARPRLEQAIRGLDQTIREVRLMAASRMRLGEGGAGRRQG